MRRIQRLPLPPGVRFALGRRQVKANRSRQEEGQSFKPGAEWDKARTSPAVRDAKRTLKLMAGETERCMYCEDSHGADIEHFWPKAPFPQCLFIWTNLLLCCTECGRLKGDRFPTDATGAPLLIDPTAEDPWEHLELDPDTGNIVARFHVGDNAFSAKGEETVKALHLDRREALSRVYRRSYLRIAEIVNVAMDGREPDANALIARLRARDDNGILAWCFHGNGQRIEPFSQLRRDHPEVWGLCCENLP